ncbi:MAG: hypothetical protein EZS28_043309, partial [Streblomastix strix]
VFVTRTSKQCRSNFSPLKDRRAEAIDAFQPSWTGESILTHPLVEKILDVPNNTNCIEPLTSFISSPRRQEDERTVILTSTRGRNRGTDKHIRGELIYRELTRQSDLNEQSIDDMITKMNQETWRKIRAGLEELSDYILENEIKIKSFISNKADIKLINAIVWIFSKGGENLKQRIKKLRMYGCATLSQFSKMKDICKQPLINQFSKIDQLAIEQKVKYNTMWNIQFLFNYIEKRRFKSSQKMQIKVMSLFIAFSATRIVELARMNLSDVQINDEDILIKTSSTTGDKLRLYTIKLTKKSIIAVQLIHSKLGLMKELK